MNTNSQLIDAWTGQTVLVIGDVMLDCYLRGSADRLCQEAPVPVVTITSRQDAPGGAANTAVNVHSLGGRVMLLSAIGQDREGDRLQQVLHERGLATGALLVDPSRSTLAKQRVAADSQLLVRFDQGSTTAVAAELEQQLIDRLRAQFFSCDAVIVSDYSYGVVTPRLIAALAELQAQAPRTIVVDAKRLQAYRSVGVTAVKPNYSEAVQLLGLPKQSWGRAEQMAAQGDRLLELTGASIAAVTLDQEGAIVFERNQPPYRTYAQPVANTRATGAGDTFVGALTLALAVGATAAAATALAAAATAVVVTQEGTTTCDAWELRQFLLSDKKQISTLAELVSRVKRHRAAARRIVLTNGCFDILHQGHVMHLNQAKALGDVLIVGVNTDETVRRLKGAERPVNPLCDRLTVLAALGCVDYVVPFAEDTPCQLIQAVQPDVFVKGGDYTHDRLPEAPVVEALGGAVVILPYQSDRSTTSLIQQIRQAYA
jgi:D-beta-D-heptose 7-phosphate kinase/D-beta-D-heptose 1-phosphate adenosyltransferase